ncbi:MAG TPA: TlpA family protein disulfide reductase [Ignavibacteria bacterium]|nr:TlpA family protein disulfide reductase [Ignavibacteria bacterium]
MKTLKNLSIISFIGMLVLLLTACSKPETQVTKTATVKVKNTSKVDVPEDISTLMRAMGIQQFQEKVVAPDFKLTNLKDKEVSLKDFRGKFVLLNFMATWCHWCRKEMPHLQKLHDKFKDKDFIIMAVYSDREGAKAVKPFIKKSGYTFTENSGTYNSGLLDPTGRVTNMYRVTGTPTTYLINKNGDAIGVAQGYRDWSKKESFTLIEKLINSN